MEIFLATDKSVVQKHTCLYHDWFEYVQKWKFPARPDGLWYNSKCSPQPNMPNMYFLHEKRLMAEKT